MRHFGTKQGEGQNWTTQPQQFALTKTARPCRFQNARDKRKDDRTLFCREPTTKRLWDTFPALRSLPTRPSVPAVQRPGSGRSATPRQTAAAAAHRNNGSPAPFPADKSLRWPAPRADRKAPPATTLNRADSA